MTATRTRNEPLIRTAQAAAVYPQFSSKQINEWCKEGLIPHERGKGRADGQTAPYLLRLSDYEKFLDKLFNRKTT